MNPDGSSQTTLLAIVSVVWGVVGIGMYVWYALALSRLFPKLGSQASKGWIPVVNEAEIFALGGVPAWSVVFYFLPVVNIYALILRIKATSRINAAFGRGGGLTALAVLIPPLWATILASSRPMSVAARIAPAMSPGAPLAPGSAPSHAPVVTGDNPTVADARPMAGLGAMMGASAPAPAPIHQGPDVDPQRSISPYLERSAPAVAAASPASPAPPAPPTPPAAPAPPAPPTPPAPTPPAPTPPAPAPAPAPAPIIVHNPWAPATSEVSRTPAVTLTQVTAPPPMVVTAPPVVTEIPATLLPLTPPAFLAPLAPFVELAPTGAAATAAPITALLAPTGMDDDEGEDDGETIVVDRRPKIVWRLNVAGVGEFPLTAEHVLLGRKPTAAVGTQALPIPDTTRTLSKVHARLDLVDGEWVITDLNSTNGVITVAADGTERLLGPGEAVTVERAFILGKVTMLIAFEGPTA